MGKVPLKSDGGAPQTADAANAPPETQQGDGPEEQIDVAQALLEQLQANAEGLLQFDAAGDDLLPAALHDLPASNIEHALDQLTASTDLFDLPPLDFGGDSGHGDS